MRFVKGWEGRKELRSVVYGWRPVKDYDCFDTRCRQYICVLPNGSHISLPHCYGTTTLAPRVEIGRAAVVDNRIRMYNALHNIYSVVQSTMLCIPIAL